MERGFQVWESSSLLFLKPFKRQRKRMENGLPKPHEDIYVCICSFLLSLYIRIYMAYQKSIYLIPYTNKF